jgi:hypothetical protein
MANSTAPVYIKPTVAFNRGDTFVFGAWACTADSTGSFQRRLTMPPNPETGLVTLPEVVTGKLASKFGEISLFDQHADFELGSASNSNSTSVWAIVCEPATQPSHAVSPPHERFTRGPRNLSRARIEAPPSRRAGKEPVPKYNSDSDTAPGNASDSNPLSRFFSDPLKLATVPQLLATIVRSSPTATLAAEAATTEAPTMGPTGGPVAEAITAVEAT